MWRHSISDSQTRTGWVASGGVEYAAWDHLTLKLEYLHADFGAGSYINPSVQTAPGHTILTRDVPLTNDIVRAGVNHKFSCRRRVFGALCPVTTAVKAPSRPPSLSQAVPPACQVAP